MIYPSIDIENKAMNPATRGLGNLFACPFGIAATKKKNGIP
jgi:hypothetical protein